MLTGVVQIATEGTISIITFLTTGVATEVAPAKTEVDTEVIILS